LSRLSQNEKTEIQPSNLSKILAFQAKSNFAIEAGLIAF